METLEEIQADMVRIHGQHNTIYAGYEKLRDECLQRNLPYYEVWFSNKDQSVRYLTKNTYNVHTKKQLIEITDLTNGKVFELHI